MPQTPLLTTKLYIPPPHPNLVKRPALTERLNQALHCKLTIISAPAGFGKTTLLSEWIKTHKHSETDASSKFAWLSLDEGDNNPVYFLRYLIAAIQTIHPHLGENALALLEKSGSEPSIDEAKLSITTLINDINTIVDPLVLILDDFHLINTSTMQRLIGFLIENLPTPLHLIIASRTELTLPLARLRLEGQLLILNTADLRFTLEEAAIFLNRVMGLSLNTSDIETLEKRTEGWVAGLQLAALSMQNRQDLSGFINAFTGSHRYILDYLAEEVLSQQPDAVRQFLLQTSLLNRMCGPLCDAITEFTGEPSTRRIKNGQEMLAHLEQANLFIIPLDDERRWYRYHHLFLEFLRNQLEQSTEPETLTALHHRAAEWYEQNDLAPEAAGHALAMADVDRAVRLIGQRGRSILNRSEMSTLLSWIEALPREMVRVRPRLSLFHAWALVLTGQLDAVEARVQDVERALQESNQALEIPGELAAIRGALAYFRREFNLAISHFEEALETLPPENLFLRGAVALSLATAHNLHGDLDQALLAYQQARSLHEANHNTHMTLIADLNIGLLHIERGEYHQAEACYQQALHFATDEIEAGTVSPIVGQIYVGLTQIYYLWNDLEKAASYHEKARHLGEERQDAITKLGSHLNAALLNQAQAKLAEASDVLTEAEQFSQQIGLSSWRVRLAALQAQLHLKQGNINEAVHWVDRAEINLTNRGYDDSAGYDEFLESIVGLARVRVAIIKNAPDEASSYLSQARGIAESRNWQGRLLEIGLLEALVQHLKNNDTQASTTLEEILILAESEQVIRLFVDEVGPVDEVLRLLRIQNIATNYIDKLLALRKKNITPSAVDTLLEPLSERELEILRLIEDGLSNQQISEQLFLTVGTVKWHINNIYGKLGVRRRTQAVARARELGVL